MFGGKKPTPKEQARETRKEIRHNERDIEREMRHLDREEEKLKADIKKAAAQGNQKVLRTLAGSLVQLRGQRERLIGVKCNLTSAGYRTQVMASQAAIAGTLGSVTKVMGAVNADMDAKETAKVLQEFAKQNEIMNMREDLIDEVLVDAFDGEGAEEETDTIVQQVLDEIGLNLGTQMTEAPSKLPAKAQAEAPDAAAEQEFARLEQSLAKLSQGPAKT